MGFFAPDSEPSNSTFGSIDPSVFSAPIDWNALPFGVPVDFTSVRAPVHGPHKAYEALAANGPPCQGGWCQSGGSYGTSPMYDLLNKKYCPDCAAKEWGITHLPAFERAILLAPYLIKGD